LKLIISQSHDKMAKEEQKLSAELHKVTASECLPTSPFAVFPIFRALSYILLSCTSILLRVSLF